MIESIAFRTQARTVDHLGREQIADCPTAISELWKNAYDAYARSVELHIFDGKEPVAAIFDDGHGMSYEEFIDRWLVVGTETKYSQNGQTKEDRLGLKERSKQGQKGIGRLSSANLGPLLLLISKRKAKGFVAALIDWRIFENPYLILSDIKIPVTQFSSKNELFPLLADLFDRLMENVWGGSDIDERTERIELAWKMYDQLLANESPVNNLALKPSEAIANTIVNARFDSRHLDQWSVWKGESSHGMALLVSDIAFDLRAQLPSMTKDSAVESVRDKLFHTLSSFVDPLVDLSQPGVNVSDPEFTYAVKLWDGSRCENKIDIHKQYSRRETDMMEHVLDGHIDDKGVFRGQVKAFSEWRKTGSEYVINPSKDLRIPTTLTTKVGPIDIYIATYEQIRDSSTHTDDEFSQFGDFAEKYSGLLIYRNGLRVLPYGRVDNDFFEIEMRRSKQAGREFWNARRMFGRLAISRQNNPNLKDKAGREGFIDNTAAKTLRLLVIHILMKSARDYFGAASDIRKPSIEETRRKNLEQKAKKERNKLRSKQRREFRAKLRKYNKQIPEFYSRLEEAFARFSVENEHDLVTAQTELDQARSDYADFRLPGAPKSLGSLEEEFREFRRYVNLCRDLLDSLAERIEEAIFQIKPPNPGDIIEKQLQRNAGQLQSKIKKWRLQIRDLQDYEGERVSNLLSERNKIFHAQATPFVERVKQGDINLHTASIELEVLRQEIDEENEDIFETYIRALESLKESIDLEVIASYGVEENDELRYELDRLNGLAQLGIAVEVLGHELQSYDDMIARGLNKLPTEVRASKAADDIRIGYEGLTKQLNFLSPLKLSGQRTQKYISGQGILDYIQTFFEEQMIRDQIVLTATKEFLAFDVFEQPARIYPVFINMINNSIYWLGAQNRKDKTIMLSVMEGRVVVSDNGPGIDEIDIPDLFTLFFTRKLRGGRGVGLYLCKVNLAAGGHKIEYATNDSNKPLDGANFVIDFKGANYDRND